MNSKLFNPIKNKIAATIALLFFVLLGAGSIMAMKAPNKAETPTEKKKSGVNTNKHKKRDPVVWYYNGTTNTLAAFQNGSNWNTTNSGTCGDDGPKPCQISADATTQTDLVTYLSGFNQSQILAMSTGRKP